MTLKALGWTVVALLSGCVSVAQQRPENMAFVTVYSGNGLFSGFVEKTVYADDRVVIASSDEGGRNQKKQTGQGKPGLYAKVAALVAATGPGVQVAAPGAENLCLDYGQDRVTAMPHIAGFATASASCPEPAMSAFSQQVLAAISLP